MTRSTRTAAVVPLAFNALVGLLLTLWMLVAHPRTVGAGDTDALLRALALVWGTCATLCGLGWLIHRLLERRGALLSLVAPILAFLIFTSLALGALRTLSPAGTPGRPPFDSPRPSGD